MAWQSAVGRLGLGLAVASTARAATDESRCVGMSACLSTPCNETSPDALVHPVRNSPSNQYPEPIMLYEDHTAQPSPAHLPNPKAHAKSEPVQNVLVQTAQQSPKIA
ncbi:hypothetical protein F4814DRAFT_447256 [Daldinia grandis]|nr:hypothetical protein F4814DRAFT_447256 [Daldinia grandis]